MRVNNKKVKRTKPPKKVSTDFMLNKQLSEEALTRTSFQNNTTRLTELSPVYSGIKYI
jgi:hypothetical protein